MDQAELCIIFNPAAGRNRAGARLRELLRGWGPRSDLRPTRAPGHAEELALQAAREGFGIVAAAGGDGTVHEVANGLLRAERPGVAFGVIPIGSANDYAYSLAAEAVDQAPSAGAVAHMVDVGLVTAGGRPARYFVNSLGLGLNGAVTLESRRIRRLQGLALYGLATMRALWYHYACPGMELCIDGETWQAPTLLLSVGLGKREGGFVLAPDARLGDGLFEYLHAGPLSRWEVLRFMPRLASKGPPKDHPKVRIGRCRELALRSQAALTIHLDGEFFSKPGDDLRAVQLRLLPGALRVIAFGDKMPRK
jgi:diacylglycerol kinase family enzyme